MMLVLIRCVLMINFQASMILFLVVYENLYRLRVIKYADAGL